MKISQEKIESKLKTHARSKFVPTDEERDAVRELAGLRIPICQIKYLIRGGVSEEIIRERFAKELVEGRALKDTKVTQAMYEKAIGGDVQAGKFWLQGSPEWRDVKEVQHTSPDGSMTPKASIDVTKLSQEALSEILNAKVSDGSDRD